jgi:4,5-DOPA dioxygenase extradiol
MMRGVPALLTRRSFLFAAGSAAAAIAIARAQGLLAMADSRSRRMPTLFIGHGSPMNAIEDNRWSRSFRELAATLPKPRAVIAVSAHWYTPGTFLTAEEHPKTIHDFGGFPKALFDQQYPAPGDPALARRAAGMLGTGDAALRTDWGLDHGTWTVLKYLLPDADVPVIQLSIDRDADGRTHVETGRKLAALRDEGVLILGSGNITHNLRDAFARMQRGDTSRVDWAEQFDTEAAAAVSRNDLDWLAGAYTTDTGRQCHPTPDHYLPLLYVAGAAEAGEPVSFPIEGMDAGSLSMRSVRIG